jgi:hypothetical protein
VATRIPVPIAPPTTKNVEGLTDTIWYRTWDDSVWQARLEPVRRTLAHLPWPLSDAPIAIDPDFIHTAVSQPNTHSDPFIAYFALDGSKWHSKCHSHMNLFSKIVSFTFEHFKAGSGNSDHEDNMITFLAEDRSKWVLTLDNIGPLEDKPVELKFRLTRLP